MMNNEKFINYAEVNFHAVELLIVKFYGFGSHGDFSGLGLIEGDKVDGLGA